MPELSSCYYKEKDYKAVEVKLNRCKLFLSYQTCIAFFHEAEQILYVLDEGISNTTSRHRNSIINMYKPFNEVRMLKAWIFKALLAEVI